MDGWMDGWLAGWVGGWVDGWMDGWIEMLEKIEVKQGAPELCAGENVRAAG